MCAAEAPRDSARLALSSRTQQYLSHLDSHHRIEDAYIFPIMANRLDTAKLESDHKDLEDIIHDIGSLVE